MIRRRTVTVPDPLARANVVEALAGAGGPTGVMSCTLDGTDITVTFDAATTSTELIDALIAIAITFVPERAAAGLDTAVAVALAAGGLADPELDATRIIESYLP